MKQISRILAEEIAGKLVSPIIAKRDKLISDISELIESKYLSQINPILKEVFDRYPKHCYTNRYVLVCNSGGLRKDYYLLRPVIRSCNITPEVVISDEEFDWFLNSQSNVNELYSKASKIKDEIIETLIVLKTPKRIKESFPEAYDLIPKNLLDNIGSILPVNIDKLRESIK